MIEEASTANPRQLEMASAEGRMRHAWKDLTRRARGVEARRLLEHCEESSNHGVSGSSRSIRHSELGSPLAAAPTRIPGAVVSGYTQQGDIAIHRFSERDLEARGAERHQANRADFQHTFDLTSLYLAAASRFRCANALATSAFRSGLMGPGDPILGGLSVK